MEHPAQKSDDDHAANAEVNASKASAATETKPAAAVIPAILDIVADSARGPLHGWAEARDGPDGRVVLFFCPES